METVEDVLVVKLRGELDHHNAKSVRRKIDDEYYNNNLVNMVLDLRHLNFMDSSGVGLIMGRYKKCSEQGGELSIVNINPKIERILEISGLMKIIQSYATVEEALRK